MSSQVQTQKELTLQLLEEVMELKENMAETKAEVKTINKTIHNGMSHNIRETNKMVVALKQDFEHYKGGGHLSSCPFIAEKKKKKELRRQGLHLSRKMLVGIIGLAVSLGAAVSQWSSFILNS